MSAEYWFAQLMFVMWFLLTLAFLWNFMMVSAIVCIVMMVARHITLRFEERGKGR